MINRIADIWASVESLILSQYEESINLKSLIRSFVRSLQTLEDSSYRILDFADIEKADGQWLDIIGRIKNISRKNSETDSDFKERLVAEFEEHRAGSARYIIEKVSEFTGDNSPVFFDEMPATFVVYTPNGHEMERVKLQKMAPAGVLALVGRALKTPDGKFIVTPDGKKILDV